MRLVILLHFAVAFALFARAEVIVLTDGDAACSVDTLGARVTSFSVSGRELLWQPEAQAGETLESPWVHGGIPLAWPWFGRLGRGDESIHGYAWRSRFAVTSRTKNRVVLKLSTETADLEYSVTVGSALSLRMRTVNRSRHALPLAQAFHPYFRVGERDAVRIEGVDPHPICLTNAVDRGVRFGSPKSRCAYRIHDAALRRVLRVEAFGSTGVNVWNPGAEKNCPGVIPGDEWRRFVAVEPYASGDNRFMVLKPGEEHTLGMDVRMENAATVR